MKDIFDFISENISEYGAFKQMFKYNHADFMKWTKAAHIDKNDALYILSNDDPYITVYKKLDKKDKWGSTITHIATYDTKKQVMMCNDPSLFGNVVENK